MKQSRKSADEGDKYQKINSLRLIHFVRSQDVLYNSDVEGYSDRAIKDAAWERIYKSLFPRYETLSIETQDLIGTNVRRRWKTLRNAIAREVKKNATVENYIRKKESPVIAELEFLIPHIKSAHCAKLADELGLRDCYANVNETDEQEYDDDFNDTVDLTDLAEEQPDIKPFETKHVQKFNDVPLGSATVVPQEALYPTVQLSSLDDSTPPHNKQSLAAAWRHIDNVVAAAAAAAANSVTAAQVSNTSSSNNTNWRNSYCSVVQCQEGEFMNSTLLCTNPDGEENHEDSLTSSQQQRSAKVPSPICNSKKRPRHSDVANGSDITTNSELSNACDPGEAQAKIIRLLTNMERRENREQDSQDEDRMFLLSLVSDLKRVPSTKKMLLKAEIAMAIARAIPS